MEEASLLILNFIEYISINEMHSIILLSIIIIALLFRILADLGYKLCT